MVLDGETLLPGFSTIHNASEQLESVSDINVSIHISDFSNWSDAEDNFTHTDSYKDRSEILRPFYIPEFCERTGLSIADFAKQNATQIDFFHLLFTPETFQTMAQQTNHYANCKIATKTNRDPLWKDTTTEEIRAYFGTGGFPDRQNLFCFCSVAGLH